MKSSTINIYRLSAATAGLGWFICILATIIPGQLVFDFLNFVSENTFEYHPMLDYWMKMAGIAFTFIGIGFLRLSMQWKERLPSGQYFAVFQIVCGIGVVISMVRLDLNSRMYILDCLFFFGTGIPMFWSWRRLKQEL